MSKIGLLFPGQGSQFVGMGKDIYDEYDKAKEIVNLANEILDFNIKDIIFSGNEEQLRQTEIAQPAIFIVSAMYLEKYKLLEGEFDIVAGHSLGEYSALYSAGILTFEETLRLVQKRGKSMAVQNNNGTMYAIMGVNVEEIKKYLSETDNKTVIANLNSKLQTVISGYNKETDEVAEKLAKVEGAKVVKLNVSGAFHSPLMEESKKIMEKEIDNIILKNPTCCVIPNVLAKETKDINIIKDCLKKQMTGQVNWLDTILTMKKLEVDKLYEIGSGNVLKKLNKSITLRPKCYSL